MEDGYYYLKLLAKQLKKLGTERGKKNDERWLKERVIT